MNNQIQNNETNFKLSNLILSIFLIITQIISIIFQDKFNTHIEFSNLVMDSLAIFSISFILILQFKGYNKIFDFIIFGYAFTNCFSFKNYQFNSLNIELLFFLFIVLSKILLFLATLFNLINYNNKKIPLKPIKIIVTISLIVSIIFLIISYIIFYSKYHKSTNVIIAFMYLIPIVLLYTIVYFNSLTEYYDNDTI